MGKNSNKDASKRLEIYYRSPESLTPYVKNAKVHSTEQIDLIAGQIAAFGFDQPIVIDAQGVIIKGHGRREAAIRLGLKEVPVVISTLDEYQAMASRIGDNKVAEAPWDHDLLKFDFGTLDMNQVNLDLTGFLEEERKKILEGWQTDLDTVPKTDGHTRGVDGLIKVTCSPEQKNDLKEYLTVCLEKSGFEGVSVD